MDSSTSHNFQNQFDSGLLRFHSPPSSVSSNFTDTVNQINFESDRLVSRFMNSGGDIGNNTCFQDFEDKSSVHHGINNSQQKCSGLPPYYPGQSSAMDTLFEFLMDQNTQVKNVNSNLVRQSSSPAGLFAKLSAQNGHSTAKEVGNSGGFNGSNGEVNPSTNRLKSQLSFSARIPSSLGMLSKISKIESDSITGSPSKGKVGNGNGDAIFYSAGFLYGPWNDSSHFLENFTGMKRDQENDMKLLSSSQSGELGNCVHILSHQLTLPKTSAEIAALEKFFQFQDSVPCKIRAKRGCATHPRSIAERVRRTRISERMRKLQELVPNMDKQTNTADMLDLAVEYIRDLQRQFKTLSDNRAKCKCSNIQTPVPNQVV